MANLLLQTIENNDLTLLSETGITTHVGRHSIERIFFSINGPDVDEKEISPLPGMKKEDMGDRYWYIAAFQTLITYHEEQLDGKTPEEIRAEIVRCINGVKKTGKGKRMVSSVSDHKAYLKTSQAPKNDPFEKKHPVTILGEQYYVYKGGNGDGTSNWGYCINYLHKLRGEFGAPLSMKIQYTPKSEVGAGNVSSLPGDEEHVSLLEEEIRRLINNQVYQIVFNGAPGTGKTYYARKIAKYFVADDDFSTEDPVDEALKERVEFVQFHPSYDYTDFVEGLRPVEIGEKKEMHFKRVDGIFKKFCRYVAWKNHCEGTDWAEDHLFFFIIDEINRADLSKVFGELMFCLEGDKRGKSNTVMTQYANLPNTYHLTDKNDTIRLKGRLKIQDGKVSGEHSEFYTDCFKDGFYIPENVVIIGTMNDIDRSVESMDFALRRRFTWINVMVTQDLLEDAFLHGNFFAAVEADKRKEYAEKLSHSVAAFNQILNAKPYELSSDYFISQGQFGGIPEDEVVSGTQAILKWVWEYRVKSLLKEYLRGSVKPEELDAKVEELGKKWLKSAPETPASSGQERTTESGQTVTTNPESNNHESDSDE